MRPFIIVRRARRKRVYGTDEERKLPVGDGLRGSGRGKRRPPLLPRHFPRTTMISGAEARAEIDVEDMDEDEGNESGEAVDVCTTPALLVIPESRRLHPCLSCRRSKR